MNAFVIHSGADLDEASSIIAALKQKSYSLNTLILKNGNCFWKIDASKKIKKSQLVLFVVGENSHKSPYIGWEIKEAIKYDKPIYILKLREDYILHDALFTEDSYTKEKRNYGRISTMEEIANLPVDIPAMLEHLETEEEYDKAAEATLKFAQSAGMHKEGMCWVK